MAVVIPRAIQLAVPLIQGFEGLELTAYQDTGGVWTCGYGQTGPDVVEGTVWTAAYAWAELWKSVQEVASQVGALVTVPLTDHQMAALISFTYNVGRGAFAGSTLLREINAGNLADVPHQLGRWNQDDGKVLQDLVDRRNREGQVWSTPDSDTVTGIV